MAGIDGHEQWRRQDSEFKGDKAQRVWGTEVPSGVQGQSLGGDLGAKPPS